jgi:hypothetical protein
MLFEQILATVRNRTSVVLKLLWKQIATKIGSEGWPLKAIHMRGGSQCVM